MPDKKELNGSIFDTVNAHTETLEEHYERILLLKKSDKEKLDSIGTLTQKFTDISNDFTRVENTILKSAQTTQDLMNTQNTQQWDLIKGLNAGNQEERVRKRGLTKTKLEKFWEYTGKFTALILGSGSVLYMLLEAVTK